MTSQNHNTSNFPNLFIPGAMKSGTSSLHELLDQHPDICMSRLKEPYYLINDNFEDRIDVYNEKYESQFPTKDSTKYRGDSSTSYMLFPNFIDRVKKHLDKEVKFIFILRNPIDRIYSHYWYLKGLGSESQSLREAIERDMAVEPNMSTKLPEGKFKHYFQYGLYAKWLNAFYENFNSEQILILLFEDLVRDPLKVSNTCFEFLGLQPLEYVNAVKSNPGTIVRFPRLHRYISRLAQGNNKLTKPINKLVPRRIKRYLKDNTSNKIATLSKTDKSIPNLDLSDRNWIKQLYLDDVNALKDLTGKPLEQWKDFS